MPSVRAVRTALANALTNVSAIETALNGSSYQISKHPLADPTPPVIEIAQFGQTKHQAMGAGAEWWTCSIRAYVALVTDDASQDLADGFLDNDPVTAALEADTALNRGGSALIVDRADQRFWDRHDGRVVAGVEYELRLLVSPTDFLS